MWTSESPPFKWRSRRWTKVKREERKGHEVYSDYVIVCVKDGANGYRYHTARLTKNLKTEKQWWGTGGLYGFIESEHVKCWAPLPAPPPDLLNEFEDNGGRLLRKR